MKRPCKHRPAAEEFLGRLEPDPDYPDPFGLQHGDRAAQHLYGLGQGEGGVFAVLVHLGKGAVSDDEEGIEPRKIGSELYRLRDSFHEAGFCISWQACHQLDADPEAVPPQEPHGLYRVYCLVTAAGELEDFVIHGLHSELDRLHMMSLQEPDDVFVYAVRPRGYAYGIDSA